MPDRKQQQAIRDMSAVFRSFPPAIAARMEAEYVEGLRAVEEGRERAAKEREKESQEA